MSVALGAYGLAKRYGHVRALVDATVEVHAGEVVAVLGDNGAGKSTLVKALLGAVRPDAGRIVIAGEDARHTGVSDAQRRGVECVYQDLALAPHLSAVDNLFLGHELVTGRLGRLARREMAARADAALRELSIALPALTIPVEELSGGQQQALAVARATMWATTAVVMDEPTAALGSRQSEIVSALMRTIAARGLGVLVVSHDLPRMLAVADRVVVLARGSTVFEGPAARLTVPEVVERMVGHR